MKLETIQATTNLIDPNCDIYYACDVQHLGQRLLNTHSIIMKVPKLDIELQICWSTDRVNGVRTVIRSMIHTYTELRNMIESLIHPSKVC